MLACSLIGFSTVSMAQSTQEIPFDQYIEELESSNRAPSSVTTQLQADLLDDILIHMGLGYSSVAQALPASVVSYQSGMQLSLGIDLFSPVWMAEGSFRSLDSVSTKQNQPLSQLTEFDLKVIRHSAWNSVMEWRAGAGLSARFLQSTDGSRLNSPASVVFMGIGAHLNRSLSLGLDLASRSPLIPDTLDRGAVDMTLRLDSHF